MLLCGPRAAARFMDLWAAWRERARASQLQVLALSPDGGAWTQALHRADAEQRPALQAQLQGLLPGVHRLVLDGGTVQLTLTLGPELPALRSQDLAMDALVLDGPPPGDLSEAWTKALARLCRTGSGLHWTGATAHLAPALAQAGFAAAPGQPAAAGTLQAVFAPAWQPRRRAGAPGLLLRPQTKHCMVIGAGLAGAACAASLARRGWQVTVLDGQGPAAGASGLPAGLMAPHVSPDDSPLSRLSRSGLRATWLECERLLTAGQDWAASGVLQRRLDEGAELPKAWPPAGAHWSQDAAGQDHLPERLRARAIWHARGGWIKPGALVRAWLAQPGIRLQAPASVQRLRQAAPGHWQALDAQDRPLAQAELVILAAAHGTQALLQALPERPEPGLQPIRGQVSWALRMPGDLLPPVPVNGHGSLVPDVPVEGGRAWVMGASFDRDDSDPRTRAGDHAITLGKLQQLLPESAASLSTRFETEQVRAWAAVRCAWRDHLPVVGPLSPRWPGLWLCTAFGSRGLSYSALCAELIAAWLHGEPLPLEPRLARALHASRLLSTR